MPERARTMMEFAPDAPVPAPPPAAPPVAPVASVASAAHALSKTFVMHEDAPAPVAAPPPAPDAPPNPLASTLVTIEPPPHSPAPSSAPRLATDKRTMMGISAADLFGPAAAPPAPPPAPAPSVDARFPKNTMMGVAMPGIAPIQPGVPKEPPAPATLASKNQTMMGVAMPGIAPVQPGLAQSPPSRRDSGARAPAQPPVDIVPAPPPLVDREMAPAAPVVVRKSGIPVAVVAILLGVLLLAGGLAIFLVWRAAPPLSAKPELDADGKEVLRLRCEACADGTKATFNDAAATFSAHEALLLLKMPLHVGDNPIELKLERPGMGRNETVKLTVPVQFRIHADLGTIDGPRPAISVRVEALPGTDVRVDEKPLNLDASGVGVYAIDLTSEAEGSADERRLRKEVAYVVVPKGGTAQKGIVTAQVTVLPLRVDTPGTRAVVDTASFIVAGRAYKASTVTVNGQAATVNADGFFEATLPSATPGDVAVEVRSSSPTFVARTVRFNVKRVDKLDAEAKTLEAAANAAYDVVAADVAKSVGQAIVVEGEILASTIETKVHRTVMVVDDRRGCAKGPCVVRVVLGHEEKLGAGDVIRAYGRVARPFAMSDGKTVPEIEADFILRGRGKR